MAEVIQLAAGKAPSPVTPTPGAEPAAPPSNWVPRVRRTWWGPGSVPGRLEFPVCWSVASLSDAQVRRLRSGPVDTAEWAVVQVPAWPTAGDLGRSQEHPSLPAPPSSCLILWSLREEPWHGGGHSDPGGGPLSGPHMPAASLSSGHPHPCLGGPSPFYNLKSLGFPRVWAPLSAAPPLIIFIPR